MKKLALIAALIAALLLAACGNGADAPESPPLGTSRRIALELAQSFAENLNRENYEACLENAGHALGENYDAHGLARLWLETLMKAGSFKEALGAETMIAGGYYGCVIRASHTNMDVIYTLYYTIDISGGNHVLEEFAISVENPGNTAAYALPKDIVEDDVIVGSDSGYPLKAKLTLPANISKESKIPCVVLVHDAEARDMDSSVFDNKPFRDIAYYLAAQGIAVLRYDKITYAYPDDMKWLYSDSMTIELETIYDAVYARLLLKNDQRIDQGRVYVLGHGLGGSYAAAICQAGVYNGYISMAGTPRTLVELAYDRKQYEMAQKGYSDELKQSFTDAMKNEIDKYLALDDMTYSEASLLTVFDLNGHFLKSMRDNPASGYLKNAVPALILQGTNDFEVFFDRDFELFKEFSEDNPLAEFKLYEGLNHMFMWSVMPNPDIGDYRQPGAVDEGVLSDITGWILK